MRGSTLHFQTPLENMAATRLTLSTLLSSLLSVNKRSLPWGLGSVS